MMNRAAERAFSCNPLMHSGLCCAVRTPCRRHRAYPRTRSSPSTAPHLSLQYPFPQKTPQISGALPGTSFSPSPGSHLTPLALCYGDLLNDGSPLFGAENPSPPSWAFRVSPCILLPHRPMRSGFSWQGWRGGLGIGEGAVRACHTSSVHMLYSLPLLADKSVWGARFMKNGGDCKHQIICWGDKRQHGFKFSICLPFAARACMRELRGLGVATDPSNCDKVSGQCGLSPVRDLAKVQSPPPSPTCQPGGLGTVPVEKFGKGNVKRKQKKAKAISLGEGEEE